MFIYVEYYIIYRYIYSIMFLRLFLIFWLISLSRSRSVILTKWRDLDYASGVRVYDFVSPDDSVAITFFYFSSYLNNGNRRIKSSRHYSFHYDYNIKQSDQISDEDKEVTRMSHERNLIKRVIFRNFYSL